MDTVSIYAIANPIDLTQRPDGNIRTMPDREYVRQVRKKQNKLLQSYIDSTQKFNDLRNAKTNAIHSDFLKYLTNEEEQKPTTTAVEKGSKRTIDELKDIKKTMQELANKKDLTEPEKKELASLKKAIETQTDSNNDFPPIQPPDE